MDEDDGGMPSNQSRSRARARVEHIWLTHGRSQSDHVVVNWLTDTAGDSVVHFRKSGQESCSRSADESVCLHRVEIPLSGPGTYEYRVASGGAESGTASFDAYAQDELRIGIVADWQTKPPLDALIKERVHLLLTAGDNIPNLHRNCRGAPRTNIQPYAALIAAYPRLFRSTIFMPALGNHDREIRPRGSQPPAEPVYDVDATAFRTFFPLPGDGRKWRLELPQFDLQIAALDLNHITDQGTTWQTCHPLDEGSEQYRWFQAISQEPARGFRLAVHNENNALMREQASGEWGRMLSRSTAVISGFGYFGERAEVDGVPYFNTCLCRGDLYPDPCSRFLCEEPNYMVLRLRGGATMVQAEIHDLDGRILDATEWPACGVDRG
jgi:hypothetical protein